MPLMPVGHSTRVLFELAPEGGEQLAALHAFSVPWLFETPVPLVSAWEMNWLMSWGVV